ncbi:MAG: damage-control phosphatase ARMT1 family protein [Anaerolineae bacterium]|nr:damage-control phosphatase ARMT1 family protein [Anaerolineae bacterium]
MDVNHGDMLPRLLMTSDPGSFARKTILERKPQIIKQVIADNGYPDAVDNRLHTFAKEITSQPVAPLTEPAEDRDFWNEHWSRIEGKSWLDIPWYFAESYFYRRLLEITGYYREGYFHQRDPFFNQKVVQENSALRALLPNWPLMPQDPKQERFITLLHTALWGNRADLSNFTVKEPVGQSSEIHNLREYILIDHTNDVLQCLNQGLEAVAFINDNVGADSISDLLLADFLLSYEYAETVTFHLKSHPFFVSDAMPEDMTRVIRKMNTMDGALEALGLRLAEWLEHGNLILETDAFWTSCLTFYQLPEHVHHALSRADLILLKGDVNYRRVLDDRHWPPTTQVEDIAEAFPRPFVLLRTLKGEIIAGLAEGQAEAISAVDPDWLINGKRGIIQMVDNR